MDRKGLLTILVTLGLAFSWHFFYAKPRAEKAAAAYNIAKAKYDAEHPPGEKAAVPESKPADVASAAPAVVSAVPVSQSAPEEKKTVASQPGTVDYVFTNLGGGISRVILKDHFEDKSKTPPTLIVLNEFGSIPIGALAEQPGEEALINLPWTMTTDDAKGTVTFERTDETRKISVTKIFTLPRKADPNDSRRDKLREEFLLNLDVTYKNIGVTPMMVPKYFLHTGSASPINTREIRLYQGFDYWSDGTNTLKNVDSFSAGGMLMWSHPERPIFREDRDLVRWAGVTNQYFSVLVTALGGEDKSKEDQRAQLGGAVWAKRTAISTDDWRRATDWRPSGHEYTGNVAIQRVDGAVSIPDFALTPGQTLTRNFQIYAGPREYRRLRLLDHSESDVLDYGAFLGILPTGPFSKLLLNSMNGLYNILGSYALAIIILTIIVKALLWPLQGKANKNMKKMSALQPQIKELQDKYKADPARFQQEMAKVWKKNGVNPLSGCWPMFIQIPIFIGFYNMLGKAVELRHHGFLWVHDLAAPDTVAHIAGFAINPLPLVMAASMFLQMKLGPQGGDPAQKKMFMFMPLIFIFMCYNFASALALYWTVQNIISIVQLLVNRNKNEATLTPIVAQ